MSQCREIEIKLKAPDAADVSGLLARLGFQACRPRVFERNQVLDTPDGSLRTAGKLLRVRVAGSKQTVTFKGPAEAGPHKSREELEAHLAPSENVLAIFERLGYARTFTYEKFRTEFTRSMESGVVTFDETPIGNYIEIEGEPEWIDRVASQLGFAKHEYITASYGTLYRGWCHERGENPGDMAF